MTREQWLAERKKGIGASEAASVLNQSNYSSPEKLWEEKTGRRESEDISHKSAVQYGIKAEAPLREIFALDFPRYKVSFEEYKIIRNPEYPFIFATLDGELTENETGRKGILEIKTAEIRSAASREKWQGNTIPQNYFCQVVHQLLATGYDFAWLKAQLKSIDFKTGEIKHDTRHYYIERKEVLEDMEMLKDAEIKFWNMVQDDKRPNLILNI